MLVCSGFCDPRYLEPCNLLCAAAAAAIQHEGRNLDACAACLATWLGCACTTTGRRSWRLIPCDAVDGMGNCCRRTDACRLGNNIETLPLADCPRSKEELNGKAHGITPSAGSMRIPCEQAVDFVSLLLASTSTTRAEVQIQMSIFGLASPGSTRVARESSWGFLEPLMGVLLSVYEVGQRFYCSKKAECCVSEGRKKDT